MTSCPGQTGPVGGQRCQLKIDDIHVLWVWFEREFDLNTRKDGSTVSAT